MNDTEFATAVSACIALLRRYALMNLSGDEQLADQAVTEAITAVWRTRRGATWDRSTLLTKLIQAMRHRCSNIRRSQARQQARYISLEDLPEAAIPRSDPYARLDTLRSLEQALSMLPPKDSALVRSYYLEEKPLRVVANECGMSTTWVMTKLRVLLKQLEEILK